MPNPQRDRGQRAEREACAILSRCLNLEVRRGNQYVDHSPAEHRFAHKVRFAADGCWIWQASLTHDGYGRFTVDKVTQMAHRVSYEMHLGPIPEGLQLDHLCRRRDCVNPWHLEPVTGSENVKRGVAVRTECPRGHEYVTRPDGVRICHACIRYRDRMNKRVIRNGGTTLMPNAQRDAGHRAELEACRLLEQTFGMAPDSIRRRASDGERLDVGDLIGLPGATVQVTRIGANGWRDLGRIAHRARRKAADCTIQQSRRAGTTHGVVLLRLDGASNRPAAWRAILTRAQLEALDQPAGMEVAQPRLTQGRIIRDLPDSESLEQVWAYAPGPTDLWVSTIEGWACSFHAMSPRRETAIRSGTWRKRK